MQYELNEIIDDTLPKQLNNFLIYLNTIKGKSNNTIIAYKSDLSMFLRFTKLYKGMVSKDVDFKSIIISDIDDKFFQQVSLSDLYAFMSFAENHRKNGTYARARKVASLKSFFNYLSSKAKILSTNPTSELESPKISKRNPIYLSLDESKTLLNSIEGKYKERDYCIITLFLNCGLRLSELCSIDIPKIKDDTLTVVGKGNKERTIYLNNACMKSINNYLIIRNKDIEKILDSDKDALFISRNYRRINKRSVERIVKKYVDSSGLCKDTYTPHKLRHTAATLMYKYGDVDIRSLQEILGHENVATTQIYTHVDNEKLRQAVNLNPLNFEGVEKEENNKTDK